MPLSRLLTGRGPAHQCAALPLLRDADGCLLVGLVTSRETGRWVLPKGWVKKGKRPHVAALAESRQEAGLVGEIEAEPCGSYTYRKRLHLLASIHCEVAVYRMHVVAQRLDWREKGQRRVEFFAPGVAAGLVREGQLASLLGTLEVRGQEAAAGHQPRQNCAEGPG